MNVEMLIEDLKIVMANLSREQRARLLDSTFRNWNEMNVHIWQDAIEYAIKLDDGKWIQFKL